MLNGDDSDPPSSLVTSDDEGDETQEKKVLVCGRCESWRRHDLVSRMVLGVPMASREL